MKIPTTLLYRVLLNEGLQVGCAVERDHIEICDRFKHEGMSFLTIALPVLCDALDKGLSHGRITPLMFNGFKPFKRGGSLPALLSGFFIRVFRKDGVLLEHPCVDSIRAIRQITRLFKKVELPCSSARIKSAYERYVSNDTRVKEHCFRSPTNPSLWAWVVGHLWSDLEVVSGELYCFPGIFGSGATAERVLSNERHSIKSWPTRSEHSFPSSYHASSTPSQDRVSRLRMIEEEDELPVRVVQVPKTLKTPRTISVEPSYTMLMQQSIAKPLMVYLESKRFPYNSIRFTDQSVNRDMAKIGSIDNSLATIDLSDASDLVGLDLVENIFQSCPTFLDYILDCRTKKARLPDNSVITLAKFASMGSALCFPVEAMVFFTIVCYSILNQSGMRPSATLLKRLTARVSVYGDDIIVPTKAAAGVMEELEAFGLKVNHEKSFSTGQFKESCGGDYYKGHDVTPTYVRHFDFTGKSRDPQYVAAYISLTNQFYLKGIWHASQYVREHLETVLGPRRIQTATQPVGCLHYVSLCFTTGLRWNSDRCGYSIRGPILVPRRIEDRISDTEGTLTRAFLRKEHENGIKLFRENICQSSWGKESSISHDYNPIFVGGNRTQSDPSIGKRPYGPTPFTWKAESFDPSSASEAMQSVREYTSVSTDELVRYFNNQAKTYALSVRSDDVINFDTSIKSHSLKLKNGWSPTHVGLTY